MNVDFSKSNRNPIKSFFITYPKCNGTKEDFVHKVFPKETIKRAAVFEEKHEDGTPHYHLIIQLDKGIPWKKVVDLYISSYPDDYHRIQIQKMRKTFDGASIYLTDPKKVKYIDPNPYIVGQPPVDPIVYKQGALKRNIMKLEGLKTDSDYQNWVEEQEINANWLDDYNFYTAVNKGIFPNLTDTISAKERCQRERPDIYNLIFKE